MTAILQQTLPSDMFPANGLPGVQPVKGVWLQFDDAYAAQMAERDRLLRDKGSEVLRTADDSRSPANELLDLVLELLPQHGFTLGELVECPDGRQVPLDRVDPLKTLGRLVQSDFCLLTKIEDQHVLKAAVLCFPASWSLREKFLKPLREIHDPVEEYDVQLAKRVQRLFDGVRVGQPLWRYNRLWYEDPALFQPRSATSPRPILGPNAYAPYLRSERQTILRLPVSNWVVFAIHTYVLEAAHTSFLSA